MLRTASIPLAGAALAMLLTAVPIAGATSTDTVLPIPFAGLSNGVTGLTNAPFTTHITVRTDPTMPGITRFRCGDAPYCAVVVHWRNLTTGASGASDLWFAPSPVGVAHTGSGAVVAAVTAGGAPGFPGTPTTLLPGAGAWVVP